MRVAVFVAALTLPLTAAAGPFHDVIKQPPRPRTAAQSSRTIAHSFTSASHLLYLNPCLPDGCTVSPGFDDSITDHSSIPQNPSVLTAWPHGQQAWDNLVQCVKDMYAPFDIQVTDVDPGTTDHFEVMIAGSAQALGVPGAGGVAPFVACDGQIPDNVISFVFAGDIGNQDFLCWAAAQESAHVWGLDHELNANDPMTYLTPPIKKPGFQDEASDCGEDTPRECWCGGFKQNSYQYLMDTFGPANLEPATLTITEPTDGQWVKPGFAVRFEMVSQLSVMSASLQIDGAVAQSIEKGDPLSFATSADLAGGDHTIKVTAMDAADREITSEITVHVTARCDAATTCADDFSCLGGFCLPGADVPGGLGAACTGNGECVTGSCGTDGTDTLCTAPCDAGSTCPSGYECVGASGGAGVCWPSADDGGCSTSSDSSPLFALLGLGTLVMIVRRRQ